MPNVFAPSRNFFRAPEPTPDARTRDHARVPDLSTRPSKWTVKKTRFPTPPRSRAFRQEAEASEPLGGRIGDDRPRLSNSVDRRQLAHSDRTHIRCDAP